MPRPMALPMPVAMPPPMMEPVSVPEPLPVVAPTLAVTVPPTRSLLLIAPVPPGRGASIPPPVLSATAPAAPTPTPVSLPPTPAPPPPAGAAAPPPDSAAILAAAPASAWRPLRVEDTVYLETAAGRVVIELAPAFAPAHVARVKALVHAGQFRHQKITRAQDNYVVQWGDGDHVPAFAKATLPDEWSVSPFPAGVPFSPLPDGDVYAPVVGHADGLPVARDPGGRGGDEAWPAHCYGMVGVGRGDPPDNGNGAELYVVTGHAPRHLDRNVILVGRVIRGMDKLSSLPRGTGALGFYTAEGQKVALAGEGMRLATDVPAFDRAALEVLRTDTPTWAAFVEAKRRRTGGWYATTVDRIELCNVPLPTRVTPGGAAGAVTVAASRP